MSENSSCSQSSDILIHTVSCKVCCCSSCIFQIVLVVCRSSKDHRELVLLMEAEQDGAALLEQLYFMQWSKQFLAEWHHTFVIFCCP